MKVKFDESMVLGVMEAVRDGDYSVSGYVNCPECGCIEDKQYTCTTCYGEGGGLAFDIEEVLIQMSLYIEYLKEK